MHLKMSSDKWWPFFFQQVKLSYKPHVSDYQRDITATNNMCIKRNEYSLIPPWKTLKGPSGVQDDYKTISRRRDFAKFGGQRFCWLVKQ